MKVFHVHAKKRVPLPDITPVKKLAKKYGVIGLVSSVQYAHLLKEIKKELGDKAVMGKALYHEGQVLGCDAGAALQVNDKANAFVFLGEGEFHGINVALKTEKPVFIFNLNGDIRQLDPEYVKLHEKKRWAMISKAMRAKKYGILLSTKPGQEFIKKAKTIQEKLPNTYIFITDTLDYNELANFPDIDCWINTMCPRIIDDAVKGKFGKKAFINASDVKHIIK